VSAAPRVVIGAPLYNRAEFLPAALDSLLSQTYREFLLVLVDDCSTDDSALLAQRYAARDSRVVFQRNERRLGMTENWRRVFRLGRELCPEMRYFAWASDHDLWEPEWLSCLLAELEREPNAVMVYPLNVRISASGETLRPAWTFDTYGCSSRVLRFLATCWGMVAADMVYGLYRAETLERAGVFRTVLLPDRLLMAELSLLGEFKQVPRVLWRRRFRGLMTNERQRTAFFPNGSPWWAGLPWWLTHAVSLARNGSQGTSGRAGFGVGPGVLLGLAYLGLGLLVELRSLVRRAWTYGVRKPLRMPLHHSRKRLVSWRARVERVAARVSGRLLGARRS
jgi:glycosyltransferase involved in cell wall biosynthesis